MLVHQRWIVLTKELERGGQWKLNEMGSPPDNDTNGDDGHNDYDDGDDHDGDDNCDDDDDDDSDDND